ncbi:MAG: SDR family oxidoreductase [Acidobacteria bacterium]|nr:SDR family oxidoreductase [Acidobacteriota bacterium]
MNSAWSLAGQSVLVSGANRGIGRAIAQECLELGATVYFFARNAEQVSETQRVWQHAGFTAFGLAGDISDTAFCADLVQWIKTNGAGLNAVFHNVGTNIRKKLLDYDEQEIQQVFATNLMAPIHLTRLLFPLLVPQKASMVFISSVAGLTHLRTGSPYAMTKAALHQLTRNLAVEWAGQGIRVNAIAPWYTQTPLAETVLSNPDYRAEVLARTPLGRIANAEEVARAAVFLALPAASYITGQVLAVDGGFTIHGF